MGDRSEQGLSTTVLGTFGAGSFSVLWLSCVPYDAERCPGPGPLHTRTTCPRTVTTKNAYRQAKCHRGAKVPLCENPPQRCDRNATCGTGPPVTAQCSRDTSSLLPKALIAGAAFLGLPLPQLQVAQMPETDARCPPLSREPRVWGCFTRCACLVLGIQARVGSPVSQSPVLLVRQQDSPSQTP